MNDKAKDYILGVGDAGAKRLRLLHRVYGPGTERLLQDMGLTTGLHVADIGCGVGTVALWMARQVGPTGSVLCVDNSAEQLAVAKCDTTQSGLSNVSFFQASADKINLPDESFDIVYCRFLLDHLVDPLAAVTEMRRLLRPQGTLVTETIDLTGVAVDPPNPVYMDEARCIEMVNARRGIDGASGLKIHRLLRTAALRQIEVRINQPAYFSGEEKRFWEYSVAESADMYVSLGVFTHEQMQHRTREMQRVNLDETALVALPRCVQVWGRKL